MAWGEWLDCIVVNTSGVKGGRGWGTVSKGCFSLADLALKGNFKRGADPLEPGLEEALALPAWLLLAPGVESKEESGESRLQLGSTSSI